MHFSNFEIFRIWPKIGQISFFSPILYYNLIKSPTNFIFGEYAVGGVPNFVLVFEKNRTGCFKVIRTWFFLIFEKLQKKLQFNLEASFNLVSMVEKFENNDFYELVLKK